MKKIILLLLCCICATGIYAQNRSSWNSNSGVINSNGLGKCYDIRYIDPTFWPAQTLLSGEDVNVIQFEMGGSQSLSFYNNRQFKVPKGVQAFSANRADGQWDFSYISTQADFENSVMNKYEFGISNAGPKVASANFSAAFKNTVSSSSNSENITITAKMYKQFYKLQVDDYHQHKLDPRFVEYVTRLGRDITPAGFIYRFGTHYASTTYYGGHYIAATTINRSEYTNSTSSEQEFKVDVEGTIKAVKLSAGYTHNTKSSSSIKNKISNQNIKVFAVGGDLQNISNVKGDQWAATVKNFLEVVNADLKPIYDLLTQKNFPNIPDLNKKRELLRQAVERAVIEAEQYKSKNTGRNDFFRKVPAKFQLKIDYMKCVSQGSGESGAESEYYGNLSMGFFGNGNRSISQKQFWSAGESAPLSLGTGQSKTFPSAVITYTVPVNDLKTGYVSVWGKLVEQDGDNGIFGALQKDTQLGSKSPTDQGNRIQYASAMMAPLQYRTNFAGGADNVEVGFTLTRINQPTGSYNARKPVYTATNFTSAAAMGNLTSMRSMITQGGNVNQPGVLAAAINAKQSAQNTMSIMDMGVKPTSSDLALAMRPENYKKEVVLGILERRVTPNASQFNAAIAKNDTDVIYAFMREGATVETSHVKKAVQLDNINLVKEMIKTGTNLQLGESELAYAVKKKDVPLAKDMIARGAKSNPQMLVSAMQANDQNMLNTLIPVAPATHESLEAAASMNNLKLFTIFINKGAKLSNNKPLEMAIDKRNTQILDLGLKNGGNANTAIAYAITKNEKTAIETCLNNRAESKGALTYSLKANDLNFYNKILNQFNGDANQGLKEATDANKIGFARAALETNRADASAVIGKVAGEGKRDWVQMLLDFRADANQGMWPAVEKQRTSVVDLLLANNADGTNSKYIVHAAKFKNMAMVKLLVEKGRATPDNGRMAGIEAGDVAIVRYLLEKGATASGMSLPASKGQFDMVKLLVEFGADINEGANPAVSNNKTDIAIFLLDKGARIDGLIPVAATNGNKQIVMKLLEKGADPSNGVKEAVAKNHTEVAVLLLDRGATITGLMVSAVGNNNSTVVNKLLEKKANPTEGIKVAATKNFTDVAIILLNAGADVSGIIAISSGHGNEKVVRKLLEKGANANEGIQIAVKNKHLGTAKALIEGKADLSSNALMAQAVLNQDVPMVKLLGEKGANMIHKDAAGNTFLHIAAMRDNLPLLKTLVGFKKIDIDQKNNDGNTTVHLVARDGKDGVSLSMMQFLIASDADLNLENNEGKTPLKYAKGSKIKKMLKEAGAVKKNK